MSDRDEGFLGRWAKRKAQAREETRSESGGGTIPAEAGGREGATPGEVSQDSDSAPTRAAAPAKEPEPFDLSKLPSIDDITAETSLADFLRAEVPAALRNAALKKAWALDPAVRDYVNPAMEYAWDWNGAVPGAGPLEASADALQQMARSMLSTGAPDHTLVEDGVELQTVATTAEPTKEIESAVTPVRLSGPDTMASSQKNDDLTNSSTASDAAPQEPLAQASAQTARPRRRHGGAAPV